MNDSKLNQSPLGVQFAPVQPPADDREVRQRHQANRLSWNEAAADYTANLDDAIAALQRGESSLHPIERANIGHILPTCERAVHLQCASGRDTLSLLIEGVKSVVGVDISDSHIANARRMTDALRANASWHCCDVLDTPSELNGTADLVYTGRGALCWLQELRQWAAVVHRLLKPGGVMHILDDHPALWLFDPESSEYRYSGLDYFDHSELSRGWPTSYINSIDLPVQVQAVKYERAWPLSTIFTALRKAGLHVEHLGEYREAYWDSLPNLRPELIGKVPLTFSMLVRKP